MKNIEEPATKSMKKIRFYVMENSSYVLKIYLQSGIYNY